MRILENILEPQVAVPLGENQEETNDEENERRYNQQPITKGTLTLK
jgi:hypothetical protein